MNGRVWLADLLRVAASSGGDLDTMALACELSGFEPETLWLAPSAADPKPEAPTATEKRGPVVIEGPRKPECRAYWRAVSFVQRTEVPQLVPTAVVQKSRAKGDSESDCELRPNPASPALSPWSRLYRLIEAWLREDRPGRGVDTRKLARQLSSGRASTHLPRPVRLAWTSRVLVIVDVRLALAPVRADQARLVSKLRRVRGQRGLGVEALKSVPSDSDALRCLGQTDRGIPVLALSDLGHSGTREDRDAWRELGHTLHQAGRRLFALVPVPSKKWMPSLQTLWNAYPWEPELSGVEREGTAPATDLSLEVLRLLSVAGRIEPGLLRATRLLLTRQGADIGTELEAWTSPVMLGQFETAATLDLEWARAARSRFAEPAARRPDSSERDVIALMRAWRRNLPPEIWHREVLELAGHHEGNVDAEELASAVDFFNELPALLESGSGIDHEGLLAFMRRTNQWASDAMVRHRACREALHELWRKAHEGESDVVMPGPFELPIAKPPPLGSEEQVIHVIESGGRLGISADRSGPSPIGTLQASDPVLRIEDDGDGARRLQLSPQGVLRLEPPVGRKLRLSTDRHELILEAMPRPKWAHACGRDQYGFWAELQVSGVTQRMRWIPPGSFVQGSPESEIGRRDNEGPQRVVTLTKGFWLADTPVTQGFYRVVQGGDSSRLPMDDRPVVRVDFEGAHRFIRALGSRVPEFAGRLPTEPEWEYACRAGSSGATYAGDLEYHDEVTASPLDRIAWYSGNSDSGGEPAPVGIEVRPFGRASRRPGSTGGTYPTKLKEANAWGLYDMLGNVWEFCEDRCGLEPSSYPPGNCTDPPPATEGVWRIVRGGSWYAYARRVRAAYRDGGVWRWRNGDDLGFRLAGSD